jgi:hypothetical protein
LLGHPQKYGFGEAEGQFTPSDFSSGDTGSVVKVPMQMLPLMQFFDLLLRERNIFIR